MSKFRSYFDFKESVVIGSEIFLSDSESRHLISARRAKFGDSVCAFDLKGNICECEIIDVNPKSTKLKILSKENHTLNSENIVLGIGIPKKTFDDVLRQSVEVGVRKICPILSKNCEVKIPNEDLERKAQKWTSQIIEAVKQSGNLSDFEVSQAQSLKTFFEQTKNCDLKIIASLQEDALPIFKVLADAKNLERSSKFLENDAKISKGNSVAILVGPEGDFTSEEYSLAKEQGFKPVTLGNNVMKSETAVLSATSTVAHYLQSVR